MKQSCSIVKCKLLLSAVFFIGLTGVMSAQVSTIVNQAKATYTFKSFPADTVKSNAVQFSVLASPNFEMSFGAGDSNVFDKETVTVRLVYKNVGNTKADTAKVQGILPSAGLRFVPGSTSGTINGTTVTWNIFNIAAGKTDSVSVKMIVDSTLIAGTNLQMTGKILWQASSRTTAKTFVVANFPRLEIVNTPLAAFVGSGRSISYQIEIKNTGNISSLGTVLVDSISTLGSFASSSVSPDSLSANSRIVKWVLGTVAPFSKKTITVTVLTQPNLGNNLLSNSASTFSTNIPSPLSRGVVIPITPVVPKYISITAAPAYIFGMINVDSSKITVTVKDSLKENLPDGVPVQLTASLGSFAGNQTTITTTINNGAASVYLRPVEVENQIRTSSIIAIGGSPSSGMVKDSTTVYFYPGAVTGIVINGLDGTPYKGAVAKVFNQNNQIVGADTSGRDGKFFIPLNKDVTKYHLEIFVIDKFGDTLVANANIDPTGFPIPPIVIPNTISGRIIYQKSGLPVPASGVTVFLDSVENRSALVLKRNPLGTLPPHLGPLNRVAEQVTDSKGRFKFGNLNPALYVVSIDSVKFPNLAGVNFISDTISGAFTFNLSIEIQQDSLITFALQSQQEAFAGDTLTYKISTNNTGNYLQQHVTVIDTIPHYTSFISATKGKYGSVMFDSTKRIVQWSRDSLAPNIDDSLSLTLLLSRNIPDSSRVINNAWFNSNHLTDLVQSTTTLIKSTPILFFGNFFVQKDSIVAGDSVRKDIWFSNTGTDSLRNVKIVDTVYSAGMSKLVYIDPKSDSISVTDSIVTIYVGSIPPESGDTLSFMLKTDFGLESGRRIVSSAHLIQNDSSIMTRQAVMTMIENPNLSSYLKVVKTGNKKVAEIGDIVTYQVAVSNTSPSFVYSVGLYDLLPHSFRYIKKSARYNGIAIEPVINQSLNSLSWSVPDTIPSGRGGLLVYQLAIGADALESQGINTAYASAVASVGSQLVSTPSQWQVTVRPGVFTEKGLIIGKVFYDDNRNTFQESGENGIKNVELWMEDGTKIITGDDGKFSLPEVKPGQHVIRVNERTLPKGTSLLGGSVGFAGDPSSRFVKVTESGIAKANFYVNRNVQDSLTQEVSKVGKLMAARQAIPKYVYQDPVHNVSIDTVEMVVSFAYSGEHYLQSIDVNESLPEEFDIISNSGTYKGRKVVPTILGKSVNWKLGRGPQKTTGMLRYKVRVKRFPAENVSLLSIAVVKVMTSDSVFIESNKLITENSVQDVPKNRIESSDIQTKIVNPVAGIALGDSVQLFSGDEVFFKVNVYVDPKKQIRSFILLDSLESSFVVNERSFTINGIPISNRYVTTRVRSSALTSREMFEKNEIKFLRIASVNMTDLIRSGMNEITYTARLLEPDKDTTFKNTIHASIEDQFGDTSRIESGEVKLTIKANSPPLIVALETGFTDVVRTSTNIQEKVSDALKMVESLKDSKNKAIVLEGISFENGKSTLTSESKEILDNVAAVLARNGDMNVRINGYTDNTGNADINKSMSLSRAQEVMKYLIEKGISAGRLSAQGLGSENPIATNKTEEGRAKNRRVEFERIK